MSTPFTLDVQSNGTAWLVFDAPDQKLNILSDAVLELLDRILDDVADRADIKALAVISGKPGTFIAGADVGEIGGVTELEEGEAAARRGQRILGRFGQLGKPTLAAIDGTCLGGGLELALACHFRLVTDNPATKLGLPEVRLGIIPGFGGSQRLPRLIGFPAALDLILTSRQVDGKKAARLGVADRCVPVALLRRQADLWLQHAVQKTRAGHGWARLQPVRPRPLGDRLLGSAPGRLFVVGMTRYRLGKSLNGVYPAPYSALRAAELACHTRLEDGLKAEAALVAPLLLTPTCKNLIGLFTANNEARRERPGAGRPVGRAAVLGAGVMGGGIAHLFAEQSIPVRMKDVNEAALVKGMTAAAALVDRALKRRRIDRREGARRMARIAPTLTYDGFAGVDIVVEAVVEDLGVKRAVLAENEAVLRPDAVFATNTSSIPIGEIAAGAKHPDRVVGLHFFNPVHRMPLVEVIAGKESSPEAVAVAHALARRLGKTPIVVSDTPGFLVNRILMAYLAEALKMFVEGSDPLVLDRAMRHFGMPMGPFELLDQIGFDTASKASKAIEGINGRYLPKVTVMSRLVDSGRFGTKNGKGFYHYRKGRKAGLDRAVLKLVERHGAAVTDSEAIQTRLYLPLVNESVRCLNAGVASGPADLDLGMVMGTGFPPFRGGPLRNADLMGLAKVVEGLNRLAEKQGARLAPEPSLVEMALGGRRFYPEN